MTRVTKPEKNNNSHLWDTVFFFADTLDESKLLLLREIAALTWEHPGKYKPWLCDRRAW